MRAEHWIEFALAVQLIIDVIVIARLSRLESVVQWRTKRK